MREVLFVIVLLNLLWEALHVLLCFYTSWRTSATHQEVHADIALNASRSRALFLLSVLVLTLL